MKKTISSAFILLLLLLSLWGLGAWFLGTNNEHNFNVFLENQRHDSDPVFHYELLKYDRSIFSAKAKIRVYLNLQNSMAQFIQDSFASDQHQTFIIEIHHGPFLFDRLGVSLGSSAWKINPENQLENKEIPEESQSIEINQLPIAQLFVDFEDSVEYKIPLEIEQNKALIVGTFEPKSATYKGKIISDELLFKGMKEQLQTTPFELHYQLFNEKHNQVVQLKLSADIPELGYKYSSIAEKIIFKLGYQGNITIENNLLNSDSIFLLNFVSHGKVSNYPIEKGEFTLNLNTLNLDDFLQLNNAYRQLMNLQQQSQWILEEQGELPEGQDQIWQVQDSIAQDAHQLSHLLSKVLLNNLKDETNQFIKSNYEENESRIRFSIKSESRNKHSKLSGAIYPAIFKPNEDFTDTSLLSLIQGQAQVSLDQEWFQFLSTRLPVTKPNFKLTYKQNKLLMQ